MTEPQNQNDDYRNSQETEILKEWQWVKNLPGYDGAYSSKIIEMAREYQQAVDLEVQARRLLSGVEEGRDKTLEVTPEDHKQANELRHQALELRHETVEDSKTLLTKIMDRWTPQQIAMARQVREQSIDRMPVQALHRDRDR
ncbi:hypothetical protein EV681_4552 [Advenella incenata]|uniref:Uncharacterized protein n=1 Tax=Advenella incenata TaxID=267800 RepID=A0A4Q7V999_9BURK|nr:stable inheritance protein KleA [Advenella incenata]RZT91198.1 hypothetical protein EV681_4552 [Advenella incenata]